MKPRLRVATTVERRRLSQQNFTYFVPFLPLAVCPQMPDVVAEYCQSAQRDIDIVHWSLDRQLVPSLLKRDIGTAVVFGIAGQDGPDFINFANGIVLQDEGTRSIFRIYTEQHKLIEPTVSLARPLEKILADSFTIHSMNVQSPEYDWYLVPSSPPVDFMVAKKACREQVLWKVSQRFWKRGCRTQILD